MDIYTTSFCLPRSSALSTDLASSPSSTFDLAPQSPSSAQPAQPAQPGQQRAQGHQASQSDGAVAVATASAAASSASPTEASSTTRGHSTSSSIGSGQGAPGTDATSVTGGGGATGNGTSGADGSQTDGTSAPGTALTSKRNSVDFNDAMQRLCVDTMAAHQCIVSFTPIEPASPVVGAPPHTPSMETNGASGQQGEKPSKMYNVHLSGGYQQVMAARGHVLRESPFKVRSAEQPLEP